MREKYQLINLFSFFYPFLYNLLTYSFKRHKKMPSAEMVQKWIVRQSTIVYRRTTTK
jgi:hypothetical protein